MTPELTVDELLAIIFGIATGAFWLIWFGFSSNHRD